MDELVARCRSCGYEQPEEAARCPVCLGAFEWWCPICQAWCPGRRCAACAAALTVGNEVHLGSYPAGSVVPVHFPIRNPGRKAINFAVTSLSHSLSMLTKQVALRRSEETAIFGMLTVADGTPGRRTYRVRLETRPPTEVLLAIEVVPAVRQLEFDPQEIHVRTAKPGAALLRNLFIVNTGNVHVAATIAASESWLGVLPAEIELPPGESTRLKVTARTRKTDFGMRSSEVRATLPTGESFVARVRVQLPDPEIEVDDVDFGEVHPDKPAHRSVVMRNVGKVRVACTLAADQPWLEVSPARISLPAGDEKVVRLRALIPADEAGEKTATLVVSHADGELLRVPVSLVCNIPAPILGSIRKQTLGSVATDLSVIRRFSLTNAGDGRMKCTITADQPWIEVLTPELVVTPGKKRRVEYVVHAPRMAAGVHHATIHVRGSGGDADVPVKVQIVAPKPELELLDDLDLGTVVTSGTVSGHLSVRNRGVGVLHVSARSDDARVTVAPGELTLVPGPPVKLAVAVDSEGLTGGWHAYHVRLTSNGGSATAVVRLRLPVEELEAPGQLDLGDRLAGHAWGETVVLTNPGADGAVLALTASDSWLQLAWDSLELNPHEAKSVPFRVVLPKSASGPLVGSIWLEGRTILHRIAVALVARRIELVVSPALIDLGQMRPGEERAVVFQVSNRGDAAAELSGFSVSGELEVRIQPRRVGPGETAAVRGRVKMIARRPGKMVAATLPLGDDTAARFTAQVAQLRLPEAAAMLLAVFGLVLGLVVALYRDTTLGITAACIAFLPMLIQIAWKAWRGK